MGTKHLFCLKFDIILMIQKHRLNIILWEVILTTLSQAKFEEKIQHEEKKQ